MASCATSLVYSNSRPSASKVPATPFMGQICPSARHPHSALDGFLLARPSSRLGYCVPMGSSSGFSRADLRSAALLARGEPQTVEDLLEIGQRVLRDSTHIDPAHDHPGTARVLLEAAIARPTNELALTFRPPQRARERYLSFVARRAAGEPVGLITGRVLFCGLEIRVQPGVFVPRPSSEFLVKEAAARGRPDVPPVVLDLCTGSGAVALAISHQVGNASVWGVDISVAAVRQAVANARRLGLLVHFRLSDLYNQLPAELREKIDLITGYVPYLSPEDVGAHYTETREYEPLFALLELSDDPLSLVQRVISEAPEWLRPGGSLLLEVDPNTAEAVARLYENSGLVEVNIRADEMSWDVLVEGRRPG